MSVQVMIKRKWKVDKPEKLIAASQRITQPRKKTTRIYFRRDIKKH